ncbi:hypothetical protein FQN60_009999, partial [Etheostoma spectabile]
GDTGSDGEQGNEDHHAGRNDQVPPLLLLSLLTLPPLQVTELTTLPHGMNHHDGCWLDHVAMDNLQFSPSPLVHAPQLLVLLVRYPQPVFKYCQVKRPTWRHQNGGKEDFEFTKCFQGPVVLNHPEQQSPPGPSSGRTRTDDPL